jgi:hypothetical protein
MLPATQFVIAAKEVGLAESRFRPDVFETSHTDVRSGPTSIRIRWPAAASGQAAS